MLTHLDTGIENAICLPALRRRPPIIYGFANVYTITAYHFWCITPPTTHHVKQSSFRTSVPKSSTYPFCLNSAILDLSVTRHSRRSVCIRDNRCRALSASCRIHRLAAGASASGVAFVIIVIRRRSAVAVEITPAVGHLYAGVSLVVPGTSRPHH